MFKRWFALVLVILTLTGCVTGVTGLQSYLDIKDAYQFLYPNGWVQVKVATPEIDVLFRDLIETSENLSIVISPVPERESLSDLGTPSEVGYRFMQQVNADTRLQRHAELVDASAREYKGKTYYILEYVAEVPNQPPLHSLASVVLHRGKLYTFNISTVERRWPKVRTNFSLVVRSFSVT